MRQDENRKYRRLIWILGTIVVIMALVFAYFFLFQPMRQKFILEKQTEAQIATYNFIIQDMISQIQQTGVYQVPIGNQTLILIPYQPQQGAQQTQQE
jgi:uncharacterized protein YpmB